MSLAAARFRDETMWSAIVLRIGTCHTMTRKGGWLAVLQTVLCRHSVGHEQRVWVWQTCSGRARGVPLRRTQSICFETAPYAITAARARHPGAHGSSSPPVPRVSSFWVSVPTSSTENQNFPYVFWNEAVHFVIVTFKPSKQEKNQKNQCKF